MGRPAVTCVMDQNDSCIFWPLSPRQRSVGNVLKGIQKREVETWNMERMPWNELQKSGYSVWLIDVESIIWPSTIPYVTVSFSAMLCLPIMCHLEHHTVVKFESSSKMDTPTQFLCEQCGVCPLSHLQNVAVCESWRDNLS